MKLFYLLPLLVLPVCGADIQWVDNAVIQKARAAVVMVSARTDDSAIAGFYVSEDGLVLTAADYLKGAEQVFIHNSAGERITDARLVALDPLYGLAVLATGKRAPHHLRINTRMIQPGEACALIVKDANTTRCAEGLFLAMRDDMNRQQSHFLHLWSVGLDPRFVGVTGAPVITSEGHVAGMADLAKQEVDYKLVFAVPEAILTATIAKSREAMQPLKFPAIDEADPNELVEGDPDYMKATQQMSEGEFAAAAESYRSVLQRFPQSTLTMGQAAACFGNAGDLAEARKLLETSVRRAPERMQARQMLGEVIARQSGLDKAIPYFEKLTSDVPKLAAAWGRLGQGLMMVERPKEALAAFQKHTDLMPDSMQAWSTYGDALATVGDLTAASKARDRASELEGWFFKLKYAKPKRD